VFRFVDVKCYIFPLNTIITKGDLFVNGRFVSVIGTKVPNPGFLPQITQTSIYEFRKLDYRLNLFE